MRKIILSIKEKPINIILIILTLALYFLNNLYFKKHTTGNLNHFMVGYFNDLICPLLFLSYCNILLLSIGKEIKKLGWLLLLSLAAGIVWEFVAPLYKKTAVADIWDLVCYLLGTVVYWLVLIIYQKCKRRGSENDKFEKN